MKRWLRRPQGVLYSRASPGMTLLWMALSKGRYHYLPMSRLPPWWDPPILSAPAGYLTIHR
jgi:hypothetical protein